MARESNDSQRIPDSEARRVFLRAGLFGSGLAGLTLAGLGCGRGGSGEGGGDSSALSGATGQRPLRAAFSNAGLQSTWCALGKRTAELWGGLLGVEIEWFDGEFDPEKQRSKIDSIVHKPWDFCCFQAVQIDSLAAPVRKLKQRGVPVISMDTLLVAPDKMRETGVWLEVAPDQEFMGATSTRYLMEKIGGKGKVIHIGGLSAHSGAIGRRDGFEKVRSQFPDIEVIGGGVRWCDWKKQKARDTFETLLDQSKEPIAGAFFHSDDMALACVPAIRGTIHEKMVITAVDGQKEGLLAIADGSLAATTVNPVCLIHMTSLVLGQFIARNKEQADQVPLEIVTPGPLVSRESGNLEAMLYLADPAHCMV